MNGGLQQFARVMEAVEEQMIDDTQEAIAAAHAERDIWADIEARRQIEDALPISTDAIARYHSDPAYRASVEERRAAFYRKTNAAMDAAIVRARGPHPWKD